MGKFKLAVGVIKSYFQGSSPWQIIKRAFIGFVTTKSGIENGEHIHHYDPSYMSLVLYASLIIIIVVQVFLPKAFKEEHHKRFSQLRIINLLIFAILIAADCVAKGEFRPEYLIPFLLEVALEVMHKIFF